MNKIIQLEKNLSEKRILVRARKEADEMVLTPGVHTIYFKAPEYNDLVIVEQKGGKWNCRKADNDEFNKYFNEFINNIK